MPFCPICKTEDTNGYGYCRECGVQTVDEVAPYGGRSRSAVWGDKVGTFATQVMAVSMTTALSAYLGGSLGAFFWSEFAVTAGVTLGMLTPCFLLGWFTSPWIRPLVAWIGALLPALALSYIGSITPHHEAQRENYLFLIMFLSASIAAVSVISGTKFRTTRKWYFIVVPVLWVVIVTAAMLLSNESGSGIK